jgi:hypothetical protein
MKNVRLSLLAMGTMLAATNAAMAGTLGAFQFSDAPGALTTAAAISSRVTYANPGETLKTFVAFNVGSGDYLLKNDSGNTINNTTLKFTATVTDGDELLRLFDAATYLSGLSAAGCSIPTGAANPLVITCAIKQLKSGDSFPAFTVFYEAPAKVTGGAGVGDADDSDKVKLDINITYAESDNGGNPLPNSVINKPMLDVDAVTLGTDNPSFVRSAVPKAGSSLFTGARGVATSTDKWTTTVVVPPDFVVPTGTYTTAEIAETVTDVANASCSSIAADLLTCSSSTLTIPGTFAALKIYFRRDASTLVNPNRPNDINSAKIFYSNPAQPNVQIGAGNYPIELPACNVTTYGPLPQPGIPCINKRTRYTNSNLPGNDPRWLKDWEFEIFAVDNGKYEQ